MITPPVGWPVQYFKGHSKSDDAIAATVTERGPDGQVRRSLQYPGGGETVSTGGFLRHVDDQFVVQILDKNPSYYGERRRDRAVWDFMHGFAYRPSEDEVKEEKAREKKAAGLRQKNRSNKELETVGSN